MGIKFKAYWYNGAAYTWTSPLSGKTYIVRKKIYAAPSTSISWRLMDGETVVFDEERLCDLRDVIGDCQDEL